MSKQKLLFVKIEAPSYSSCAMVQAFKDVGFDVLDFDWQEYRFKNGLEKLNEELINITNNFSPDFVFLHLQLPNIVTLETVKELSKISKVINFTEDVREDISWYEEYAPHIHKTIFTNMDDVIKLHKKEIFNVDFLHTSYNDIYYKPQPKTSKYYGDIVFIGNNYLDTVLPFQYSQERLSMAKALKEEFGDVFQFYGLNWGKEVKMLNPQEVIEAYNNAKIVITQNNFVRRLYQSDRAYNAIGCGAFVLAREWDGGSGITLEEHFDGFVETWFDIEELIFKCKQYLIDDNTREVCAKKAHEHIVKNHRWQNRFEELKDIING